MLASGRRSPVAVKPAESDGLADPCSRLISNATIYFTPCSYLGYTSKKCVTAGDLEAIKILMSSSLVGCGSANLIGNFDFTISSSPINIKALAGCYQDEDLWDISMTEGDDDRPQAC